MSMSTIEIDHAGIAARIPHSGPMCLLACVERWSNESIECRATSHRAANHPLAQAGRLDALTAIEYAAQAMAVHGALCADATLATAASAASAELARPKVGYLASVRDVVCAVPYLHDLVNDLQIVATQLVAEDNRVLYEFTVSSAGQLCVSGRAAVVMDVGVTL